MGGMAKDAMGGMGGIIGMKKGASAPHSPTPDNGPTPDNRTTPDNGNSVDDAARKREEERKKFLKQKVPRADACVRSVCCVHGSVLVPLLRCCCDPAGCAAW